MKHVRVVVLVCAAGSMSASWAQSSVTMYGTIDNGMEYVSDGVNSSVRQEAGLRSASRWGMMGSEDLGSGLRANFRLESGLATDTGSLSDTTRLFGRYAIVGLSDKQWGSVDLGRVWTPGFWVMQNSDVVLRNRTSLMSVMFTSASGQNGAAAFTGNTNNVARYRTPKLNGFEAEFAYAPGEATTGSSKSGTLYGGNIQYSANALYVGYSYQVSYAGSAAAPLSDPAKTAFHILGAAYQMGQFKVFGTVMRSRPDAANTKDIRIYQTSASWKPTTTSTVYAQYVYRDLSSSADDASGVLLGYDYALSRRTTLYAMASKIFNKNQSNISLNSYTNARAGLDPRQVGAGIRHMF